MTTFNCGFEKFAGMKSAPWECTFAQQLDYDSKCNMYETRLHRLHVQVSVWLMDLCRLQLLPNLIKLACCWRNMVWSWPPLLYFPYWLYLVKVSYKLACGWRHRFCGFGVEDKSRGDKGLWD